MAGLRDVLSRPRWAFVVALALITFVGLMFKVGPRRDRGELAFPLSGTATGFAASINIQDFAKPSGVKIIGLVFFGRKDRVEMLRCYLEVKASRFAPPHGTILTVSQRNLVSNGGWLDEVHWVLNTGVKKDLRYLESILASEPRYKKIDLSDEGIGFEGYGHAWGHLERDSYYVKIDDDVGRSDLDI